LMKFRRSSVQTIIHSFVRSFHWLKLLYISTNNDIHLHTCIQTCMYSSSILI
jgi:hypothetical protein